MNRMYQPLDIEEATADRARGLQGSLRAGWLRAHTALKTVSVPELLRALGAWAPEPRPQPAEPHPINPSEPKVTGFVFKVQANMDANHRDRVAFVRLSSGTFQRGMKLKNEHDAVVSCDVARDDAVLLFVSSSGHGKRTQLAAFNRQGRGGQGVRGMRVTEARGEVVAAFTVVPGDEILVFSSAGNLVRMGVDEISEQGRDATGVRVARVDEGDTVVAVARVLEAEPNDVEPNDVEAAESRSDGEA